MPQASFHQPIYQKCSGRAPRATNAVSQSEISPLFLRAAATIQPNKCTSPYAIAASTVIRAPSRAPGTMGHGGASSWCTGRAPRSVSPFMPPAEVCRADLERYVAITLLQCIAEHRPSSIRYSLLSQRLEEFELVLRSDPRRFCWRDHVSVAQHGQEPLQCQPVAFIDRPLLGSVTLPKARQHQSPEEGGENLHRQEVVGAASDPPGSVSRRPARSCARGDDASSPSPRCAAPGRLQRSD